MKWAICFALAGIVAPYLITTPGHVHALLIIVGLALFGQSVLNYSQALDMDVGSSAVAVFIFILFISVVAHQPLSWLSLILHGDPSQVPARQRPRPISQWFRKPRQLIPPDSHSQAPPAKNGDFVRMLRQLRDLQIKFSQTTAELMDALRYKAMWEQSEADKRDLEAKIEGLNGDVKTLKEDKIYMKAELDNSKKETARHKARVDECEDKIVELKVERGKCIYLACRRCKSKLGRCARGLVAMAKMHVDAVKVGKALDASSRASAAAAKRALELKDQEIADKDKALSAKGNDASGGPSQVSLFKHIGVMDAELRAKDAAMDHLRAEKDGEITRLHTTIDARSYCCCGRCPGGGPSGGPDDGEEDGDDGDDGTSNGGPPQGGDAQPRTPASEPSGAPPCPVGGSSNPPPPPSPTASPSDDDAAGPAGPAGPIPSEPTAPWGGGDDDDAAFPPASSSAARLFAPAAAGFGPASSLFVPPAPATETSGIQPPTHGT